MIRGRGNEKRGRESFRGRARFDRTGAYRFSLERTWDAARPRVAFVMLNPHRADAVRDDPTIRRCVGFARAWGFGSLEVVNLFAWRCRDPKELRRVADPVGPRNDRAITRAARRASRVVLAWGAHGSLGDRRHRVLALLDGAAPLACLGRTKRGEPRHPLYLRRTARLRPFGGR